MKERECEWKGNEEKEKMYTTYFREKKSAELILILFLMMEYILCWHIFICLHILMA